LSSSDLICDVPATTISGSKHLVNQDTCQPRKDGAWRVFPYRVLNRRRRIIARTVPPGSRDVPRPTVPSSRAACDALQRRNLLLKIHGSASDLPGECFPIDGGWTWSLDLACENPLRKVGEEQFVAARAAGASRRVAGASAHGKVPAQSTLLRGRSCPPPS
jgi:hypothetical protein